ncbi:MAG: hypothetical protein ACR2JD_07545 [Nocardioides sp.]
MTEGPTQWEERRDLERPEKALAHEHDREPPAERVAAVRAAAERLQPSSEGPESTTTEGRRPGRRELLLGGIAASATAVAGYAAGRAQDSDTPVAGPPTEEIEFRRLPEAVAAQARLINHTWGTELMLEVSGLPAGETYDVVYLDGAGTATQAGSFFGVADVVMLCRFNAAPLRADVRSIEVRRGGDVVLRSRLA